MTDMLTRPTGPTDLVPTGAQRVEELDGRLTCTGVRDVTHDVRTFELALPGGGELAFLPGQYLTLRVPVDDHIAERCYTISSPPTRPERVTITVKRVPGGPVSNRLHDSLRVGDVIEAHGPYGDFSLAHHPAQKYLFLTAGSGITPAMSMLRTLCDTGSSADVAFVHCARTPEDIVFRDELAELATRPGVTVALWCEGDSAAETWTGRRGRLDLPGLLRAVPDLLRRETFTCGPPPYMAGVREMLAAVGADPARTHEESFVLGADGPVTKGAGVAAMHRVTFARSGITVECDAHTPILQAGRTAGLTLPSSCEEGVCGTCRTQLLEGSVDMRHNGGIRPREIARDAILPCCSRPLEDVVVDS